jgi:hypothetical protein
MATAEAESPAAVTRPPLDIVQPSAAPVTATILLYGPPKVGKTTGAASGPGRTLYANCELPAAMLNARKLHGEKIDELRVSGLQTLVDVTNHLRQALEANDCPWSTLAFDPMSDLYRILIEDLSNGSTKVSLPTHLDAQTHIERFCRAMCELPINTVWVAHETTQKDEVQGHFEAIPAMGTTNPNPAGKLMAMVDVIGYCGVVDREGQPPEYQAQLINANGRRGGDRFNALGKARTLNLAEWLDLIRATDNHNEGRSRK